MTDKLLNCMLLWQIIDKDETEIYRFGLESMKLKVLHYSTYLLIAIFTGELTRFLTFFIAFSLIRKNRGGYHAETSRQCYVVSCLTVGGFCLLIKILPLWKHVAVVLGTIVVILDVQVWKLAPSANKNRELDRDEIVAFRKKTRIFLAIDNVILIILFILRSVNYATAVSMAIILESILLIVNKMRWEKPSSEAC